MLIFNAFYRTHDAAGRMSAWMPDLSALAAELAAVGFTDVLTAPLTMSQGGDAPDADGYGKFNDYDLGHDRPTRWGTLEDLRATIATLHAAGLRVLSDMVIHQYDGGHNGVYQYRSSTGTNNGRFPKTPWCFVGAGRAADDVFDPEGNAAFGDMVTYTHDSPPGYMRDGIIAAIRWQLETLGLDGFRLDDTKGENAHVVNEILTARGIRDAWVFGECFTGNPQELERWVQTQGGRAGTLDFGMHWALQGVCDHGASCRTLDGNGLVGIDPAHAITFVDTADTDGSDTENIKFNKLLAYARILTGPGVPMVYARDYLTAPGCYGLKPWIDNLVWIARAFAYGAETTRWVDDTHLVRERNGDGGQYGWSGGLLTVLSWAGWEQRITVQTGFGPHRHLHDYTGHHDDIWTDAEGRATFTALRNDGRGLSYSCFAPAGVQYRIPVQPRTTTQEIYGAPDLLQGNAKNGMVTIAQRFRCAKGTAINIYGGIEERVPEHASVQMEIVAPDGELLVSTFFDNMPGEITRTAQIAGWYTVRLVGNLLPEQGVPFFVGLTYMGVQG